MDAEKKVFYMGSMHLRKIVKFALNGTVSHFVSQDVYDLMPVGGVHVDPVDHSVWASTDAGEEAPTRSFCILPRKANFSRDMLRPVDALRFERFGAPRQSQYIFTTDTEGHHVYRFDRASHTFKDMKFYRPVFLSERHHTAWAMAICCSSPTCWALFALICSLPNPRM